MRATLEKTDSLDFYFAVPEDSYRMTVTLNEGTGFQNGDWIFQISSSGSVDIRPDENTISAIKKNTAVVSFDTKKTDIYGYLESLEKAQELVYIADDIEAFTSEYAELREADFGVSDQQVQQMSRNACAADQASVDVRYLTETTTDNSARRALASSMGTRLGGINIESVDVSAYVQSIDYKDGCIVLALYEWTFCEYTTPGVEGVDTMGFGTEHTIVLQRNDGVLEVLSDEYDESDMTGMTSASYARNNTTTVVGNLLVANDGLSLTDNELPLIDDERLSDAAPLAAYYSGYSCTLAVNYADTWVKYNKTTGSNEETYYNPCYRNMNALGGDCANYVSQSLSAGRLPQVSGSSGWYYNHNGTYNNTSDDTWASAWSSSTAQWNFMKSRYGTGYQATAAGNVKPGCPVYYANNADGSGIFHTEICVGWNSAGKPITNSHNGDRYHVAWDRHGAARNTVKLY